MRGFHPSGDSERLPGPKAALSRRRWKVPDRRSAPLHAASCSSCGAGLSVRWSSAEPRCCGMVMSREQERQALLWNENIFVCCLSHSALFRRSQGNVSLSNLHQEESELLRTCCKRQKVPASQSPSLFTAQRDVSNSLGLNLKAAPKENF